MKEELVFIDNGVPVTDSLTVAEVFGKDHNKVMRDIRKIIESVDVEWGVANFGQTQYEHPQNRQTYDKYIMTEDGFTILVMGYTGKQAMEFKVKYIKEFRRMQEQLVKQQPQLPNTYKEALVALLAEVEKNEQLESKNKLLLETNKEMQPKVELHDRFMESENLFDINRVAKDLGNGWGRNRLFEFLREKKVFFKRGSSNFPYQQHLDNGNFEVKEIPKGIASFPKIYATVKGVTFIFKLVAEYEAQLAVLAKGMNDDDFDPKTLN